jgi:hypothetical protein
MRRRVILREVILIINKYYYLDIKKQKKYKLVKVTELGYNFLDEEKNKYVLKKHLYIPKDYVDECNGNKKLFNITSKLNIFNEDGKHF